MVSPHVPVALDAVGRARGILREPSCVIARGLIAWPQLEGRHPDRLNAEALALANDR
jgi:hypothetical protein